MVDPELLEILVCPETHQPVRPAAAAAELELELEASSCRSFRPE